MFCDTRDIFREIGDQDSWFSTFEAQLAAFVEWQSISGLQVNRISETYAQGHGSRQQV